MNHTLMKNQQQNRPVTVGDELRAIQSQLDECEPPTTLGSCMLAQRDIAQIVQDALLYFEGTRYYLWAWCIMPNHVHVIVTPTSHTLGEVEHSWKSFTAHKIGKVLGTRGAV